MKLHLLLNDLNLLSISYFIYTLFKLYLLCMASFSSLVVHTVISSYCFLHSWLNQCFRVASILMCCLRALVKFVDVITQLLQLDVAPSINAEEQTGPRNSAAIKRFKTLFNHELTTPADSWTAANSRNKPQGGSSWIWPLGGVYFDHRGEISSFRLVWPRPLLLLAAVSFWWFLVLKLTVLGCEQAVKDSLRCILKIRINVLVCFLTWRLFLRWLQRFVS